jgi:hypothetical protein
MYIVKVFLQNCLRQRHTTDSTLLAQATLGDATQIRSLLFVAQG